MRHDAGCDDLITLAFLYPVTCHLGVTSLLGGLPVPAPDGRVITDTDENAAVTREVILTYRRRALLVRQYRAPDYTQPRQIHSEKTV